MAKAMVLLVALFLASGAVAQQTEAICKPEFQWMDNSLGQSPCLVDAYLASVCSEAGSDVPALPVDGWYQVEAGYANPCLCSSVLYSVMSACTLCQDGLPLAWSNWTTNCTTVDNNGFPDAIPSATTVPSWAYLDVTGPDMFNVTAAQALAEKGGPKSRKNIRAIVGGAVGGVLGLIILFSLGFLGWRRHLRTAFSGSDPVEQDDGDEGLRTQDLEKPATADVPSFPIPVTVVPMPELRLAHPPKLYNPDDPSTFPDAPRLPVEGNAVVHEAEYTGAPEL